MKNVKHFVMLALLLALATYKAPAQTITVSQSALEVVTAGAGARSFYPLDAVVISYRASTAAVVVKSAEKNTTLFDGDTSEVTITGLTTWASKLTKLATWMQDATTTTGYRYFLPKRGINYRYRSNGELTAIFDRTKETLLTTSIDSLKITGVTGASNKLTYLRGKYYLDALRDRLDVGQAATIAAGAAAGSSPTVAITAKGHSGLITVTTGSSPTTTGILATVTLPVTYPTGSFVTLTPADSDAAAHVARIFVDCAAGTFTLNLAGTALTGATEYKWTYSVTGY